MADKICVVSLLLALCLSTVAVSSLPMVIAVVEVLPVDQFDLGFGGESTPTSPPEFTSVIADSLVGGVGMLVVIPVLVGGIAVVLGVLMFRSGRFDGESILPYIAIVAVTGVVAVVAVSIIYMIGNVFVPAS